MEIVVKIPKGKIKENSCFKGLGMVSGNNSSRLLIDYKRQQPESYQELLRLMFDSEYLGITHLKIEMGSDINSSSGTEPAVMRSKDETSNVRRGAGYMLCAAVKAINPDITLDMLFWSEPAWVRDSNDVYNARYRWYKETLTAAYETFGIKFDCISVNRNERAIDPDWIKYCAARLKQEKDCPYDFGKIKLVAADEEGSWNICELMAQDRELLNAVDIIGAHYTSHCTDTAKSLWQQGKELWFTEGCPPMSYSKGTARFDGSGLDGINGVLDIANRIIAMYPCGCMTLYEFQPVVSAYYDDVTYGHKSLITANEPWSGFYSLESGFYMALHFSKFIKKGWIFIDGACYCDGEKGGDGHALVNTVNSFLTAADPETGDHSTVIVNSTRTPLEYVIVSETASELNLWETRGTEDIINEEYDSNYFKYLGNIKGVKSGSGYEFKITVNPLSMVTATTLNINRPSLPLNVERKSEILSLPYCDSFEYPHKEIEEFGGAPLYTTDQGGAFEVTELNGKNVLMQMITPDIKAEEWGFTPLPLTCFGDDRWFNYSVSAAVTLSKSNNPKENFAGIGLRYSQACKGISGYSLLLYENGNFAARRNEDVKAQFFDSSSLNDENIVASVTNTMVHFIEKDTAEEHCAKKTSFECDKPHILKITAVYNKISFFIDGELLRSLDDEFPLPAGRAAFFSSYNKNSFSDFKAEPAENISPYVRRYDDTDGVFSYTGEWEHKLMSSFSDYKRTVSVGKAGAGLKFSFNGTGFGLFGTNKDYGYYKLFIDGKQIKHKIPDLTGTKFASIKKTPEVEARNKLVMENCVFDISDRRRLLFFIHGLAEGEHRAEIEIFEGELCVDGAEVLHDGKGAE